ncbi:MAG: conjugal transfer protein [Chthoniobacteraceae bacterium]|nr:conjugal transfer protein [Chthoniobacteraceae bacterium]
MLSPKTQTNLKNARAYFEEHIAIGEYYGEDNRVTGEWLGHGAESLGLRGVVSKEDFLALCENVNPATGQRLTQRMRRSRDQADSGDESCINRRIFYDFTFSPPKSVSIAALFVGDARLVEAHRVAVKIAMHELEAFAATRVRMGGAVNDRRTGNIVAALFDHDTSRALDPHLHTHCVVFNATHDSVEARWKALHNYDMLSAQKFVENVYYHELARELWRFGYDIENSARGDFQIRGVSRELCDRFSKRHQQIDEKTRELLAAHPEKSSGNVAEIRERMAYKTRAWKSNTVSSDRLRALWDSQLTPVERESLSIPRNPQFPDSPQHPRAENAVSWAEDHLFERRSVVAEHELWRYALEFARGSSLSVADIQQETARRPYIRDERGRITRRDVMAREWEILQIAKTGVRACKPMLPELPPLDSSLAEDQQRALDRILASRDFVTLFRGGAGTGKSYVLRRVQEAIEAAGLVSVILAPQRQQVIDLQKDGLRHASTVAQFIESGSLPKGAVLIVDEAGQIGAGQMMSLLKAAGANDGRVILSGDTRQHGPVEPSDALRAIERYSGLRPAELNTIRRQDPESAANAQEKERIREYRQAVKEIADGDLATSFDRLDKNGAIRQCAPESTESELADAYVEMAVKKQSVLVVSQTWASINPLNDKIRAGMRERGLLSKDEKEVTALKRLDLTSSQKCDQRFYPEDHVIVFNRRFGNGGKGDTGKLYMLTGAGPVVETSAGKVQLIKPEQLDAVTICRPRPLLLSRGDSLQLKANATGTDGAKFANGEIVTVAKVEKGGGIKLKDGRRLPASYRQFVRGYAVTSYGSQGKTVDHVLLADAGSRAATNAQQWYVSVSRGRKSVRIFTPDKAQLRESIVRSGDRPLAIEMNLTRQAIPTLQYLRSLGRGRAFARIVSRLLAKGFHRADAHQQSITP